MSAVLIYGEVVIIGHDFEQSEVVMFLLFFYHISYNL